MNLPANGGSCEGAKGLLLTWDDRSRTRAAEAKKVSSPAMGALVLALLAADLKAAACCAMAACCASHSACASVLWAAASGSAAAGVSLACHPHASDSLRAAACCSSLAASSLAASTLRCCRPLA